MTIRWHGLLPIAGFGLLVSGCVTGGMQASADGLEVRLMRAAVEAVVETGETLRTVLRVDTLALPATAVSIEEPGPIPFEPWSEAVSRAGWATGDAAVAGRCLDEAPEGVWLDLLADGTQPVSEACWRSESTRFTLAVSRVSPPPTASLTSPGPIRPPRVFLP